MVGIHEPPTSGHDTMAVTVRIVAEGNVEVIFQLDQVCHGIRRGTVHPDFAILVHRHKRKGRINFPVHNFDGKSVFFGNGIPEVDSRTTEGVNTYFDTPIGDDIHIDDILEILNVGG